MATDTLPVETPETGIETRFEVQSVQSFKSPFEQVELTAVTSTDEEPENRVFAAATPFGKITLGITNPNARGLFEPGDKYRVTFERIVA